MLSERGQVYQHLSFARSLADASIMRKSTAVEDERRRDERAFWHLSISLSLSPSLSLPSLSPFLSLVRHVGCQQAIDRLAGELHSFSIWEQKEGAAAAAVDSAQGEDGGKEGSWRGECSLNHGARNSSSQC